MNGTEKSSASPQGRFDIQQALNQIEEIILDSPRLPMTGRTLINEDEILDQLDAVRLNLPSAFQEAQQILQQRDDILTEAEQYAQEIVATAEKQAATILNEMSIVRQAEQQAQQLKFHSEQQAQQLRAQVEQDCADLQDQTLAEIEQLKQQARQEWAATRERAITEAQTIQEDADAYADQVLQRMERQFGEMLHVIRNGRQQLFERQAGRLPADTNGQVPGQLPDAAGQARPSGPQRALGVPRPSPNGPGTPPSGPGRRLRS